MLHNWHRIMVGMVEMRKQVEVVCHECFPVEFGSNTKITPVCETVGTGIKVHTHHSFIIDSQRNALMETPIQIKKQKGTSEVQSIREMN